MKLVKLSKLAMLAGLTAMFALVLAACGGDDPTATPTAAVAEPTATPEPVDKPTLIFGDLNWNSAQIQNAIARAIAERGYGYETDAVFGGTIPLLEALSAGDTNINMELWLPNQLAAWEEASASGEIKVVGNSLEDNWQSSYVIPQYTADANPGLKSVSDIPEYAHLFTTTATGSKARSLGCIPGWECEVINEKKLAAYNLEDSVELVNPGSLAALDAELIDAFSKKEDILFYYWGPTTLSNKIDKEFGGYVTLEEPAYTEACAESDWACAYSVSEVLIAMRTELIEAAPDIAEFLGNWDFNAGNQLAAEGYMADSGEDFPEVAEWFLQNTEEWKTWATADAVAAVMASF